MGGRWVPCLCFMLCWLSTRRAGLLRFFRCIVFYWLTAGGVVLRMWGFISVRWLLPGIFRRTAGKTGAAVCGCVSPLPAWQCCVILSGNCPGCVLRGWNDPGGFAFLVFGSPVSFGLSDFWPVCCTGWWRFAFAWFGFLDF